MYYVLLNPLYVFVFPHFFFPPPKCSKEEEKNEYANLSHVYLWSIMSDSIEHSRCFAVCWSFNLRVK